MQIDFTDLEVDTIRQWADMALALAKWQLASNEKSQLIAKAVGLPPEAEIALAEESLHVSQAIFSKLPSMPKLVDD